MFDTHGLLLFSFFFNLFFILSTFFLFFLIIVKALKLGARPWDVIILRMKVGIFLIDLYLQNMIVVIITFLHNC